MPFLGKSPADGNNNVLLDAVSTADNTAGYALTKDSVVYTPISAQSLMVSLNGVTQAPIAAYTVSGNTITFASNLMAADVIDYIIAFEGPKVNASIDDDTITTAMIKTGAVTVAKMAVNSIDSDQYVDGSIDTAHIADNAVTSAKLAAGAGGLDWQTTAKTTSFTAEAEKGYLVDSANTAITVTLPASATVGDKLAIVDATGSAPTNNITLNRNGLKLYGDTSNLVLDDNRVSVHLIYADATNGWVPFAGLDYTNAYTVEALIVAGGGAGGEGPGPMDGGAGGSGLVLIAYPA